MQALPHLVDSLGVEILLQIIVFEIVNPFIQAAFGHVVEVIDLDDVVFRIDLADHVILKDGGLPAAQREDVVLMDAAELGLAVIDIILAVAEVKIDEVDRVDFPDLLIQLAFLEVIDNELGGGKKRAVEVVPFGIVLQFHDNELVRRGLHQHIQAVALEFFGRHVAFAFQQLPHRQIVAEQGRQKALQNFKIRLVPEHFFHRPVEADEGTRVHALKMADGLRNCKDDSPWIPHGFPMGRADFCTVPG